MTVSTAGIIKGRQIQLDRKTGLPAGARVQVQIKTGVRTLEQKRREAARLFGSCAHDATLVTEMAKRERQRHASPPR